MSHRDNKELNDFTQKMRKEGSAGFGAGPVPDAAQINIKTRPAAAMGQANNRPRSAAHPVKPDNHAPCRLGDRILTGLAIMSLGMLIVGGMGAYLSNVSQQVGTTTRSEPGAPALLQDRYETRFGNLEKRLADINDLYSERFHSLESKLAQTVDPYEARLMNMERRLEQANDPNDTRLRDVEARLEQLDAPNQEARLQAVEHRLEQAYSPYAAALQDMENRMGQGYAGYEARLRELENRLMQIQVPYEERLQDLEQRLTYAAARLDYLSAEMESFISNNNAIIEANATLRADPPAAMPVEPLTAAPLDAADPQRLPAPPATQTETATASAAEPDADTWTAAAVAPPTSPDGMAAAPGQDTPWEAARDESMAFEPVAALAVADPDTTADAVAVSAPTSQNAEAPATQAKPADPARDSVQDSQTTQTNTGDWVINLASYASETIAARKLADFERKGVAAEQVAATVNGKIIYRVRIAGFDTRKAAMVRAEAVRQQLGLEETWVTKQ